MNQPLSIEKLNDRFALPDRLSFEAGGGGLACAVVTSPHAQARAYLYGAHVTHYQPAGHDPVLFLSPLSKYGKGKAIRGGVPICFPWFGPNTDDPWAPQHGPARTTHWTLTHTNEDDCGVSLRFEADFKPFAARHQITFGQTLSMALSITNISDAPAHFEAAQHTYLNVKDARNIRIAGLAGTDYFDKTDHGQRKTENQQSIQLVGETDRLYVDTALACVLSDPGLGRSITVKKSGSNSTVIWNPWAEKAKAMGDFGDNDWPQMVCIESANAGPNKVTLEPGAEHVMQTVIETARL